MPLTVHETAVFVELETVAENGSVSPSNTLPEAGVTVTEIAGGGGGGGAGLLPLAPPPQAARATHGARVVSIQSARRGIAARRMERLWCDRVCERDCTVFAIADEWPAKTRRRAMTRAKRAKILCVF